MPFHENSNFNVACSFRPRLSFVESDDERDQPDYYSSSSDYSSEDSSLLSEDKGI